MSLAIVKMHPKNPNSRGGCACSPHGKRGACTPPYACFTATEAHDPRNPVLVVGFPCLQAAMEKASRSPQGAAELRRQADAAPPEPEPIVLPKQRPYPDMTVEQAMQFLQYTLGSGE